MASYLLAAAGFAGMMKWNKQGGHGAGFYWGLDKKPAGVVTFLKQY